MEWRSPAVEMALLGRLATLLPLPILSQTGNQALRRQRFRSLSKMLWPALRQSNPRFERQTPPPSPENPPAPRRKTRHRYPLPEMPRWNEKRRLRPYACTRRTVRTPPSPRPLSQILGLAQARISSSHQNSEDLENQGAADKDSGRPEAVRSPAIGTLCHP